MSTPSPPYGNGDASLLAMGGPPGVRKLVDTFYDVMSAREDARGIRSMHPEDLTLSREKLAVFLVGWLGGPKRYRERFGPIRIPQAHAHLPIGENERDVWLACMQEAINAMPVEPSFKHYFMRVIAVPASRCVNQ